MNNSNNKDHKPTLDELITDESFIDWVVKGKADHSTWGERLQVDKQFASIAEEAIVLIERLRPQPLDLQKQRVKRIKSSIDAGIESRKHYFNPASSYSPKRSTTARSLVAAASVLILLASVWYFMKQNQFSQPTALANPVEKKVTEEGQKLTFFLSDGTKVKLNAESVLNYQRFFTDSGRVVTLTGEAFFEVAKDSLRPFLVHSGHSITEALGTSFNIKNEEEKTSIALVSGKISVRNTENQQVLLNPGEMVTNEFGSLGDKTAFNYEDEIAWKDGKLVFREASSTEVFSKLRNWFGVEFKILLDDEAMQWHYSGQFTKQSLKDVLISIGYSENFEFSIENNLITITDKREKTYN